MNKAKNGTEITITRPDDWHLHLRDGKMMSLVLQHSARVLGRAIIMPNLTPPVTTVKAAFGYRTRILNTLLALSSPRDRLLAFNPLMTLYLTDNTPPEEIVRAKESGFVFAVKDYPAGATTNSDAGVTDLSKCSKTLERMQELNMPLLLHGEVTDPEVDIFDREAVFLDRVLGPLTKKFSELKIVLEHVTTREGIKFVEESGPNIAATITAHHLLMNRNAIFQKGIRPHNFCLPIAKREQHRLALLAAATSGNPKFFLGTDSAPHAANLKENACGCAGCYTADRAIELYAEAFDSIGGVYVIEGFTSLFGADFYGLPRNKSTITLRKESWVTPTEYSFGDNGERLIPFRAGEQLAWQIV